jgi:rhodanese-related sulfurtransferase
MLRFPQHPVSASRPLFLLFSLLPSLAAAQAIPVAQPARQPNESLQCRIEDVPPSQRTAQRAAADNQCLLNPAKLASVLQKPGIVVVDTRSRGAQDGARIPNALATTVSELRHQPALRKSPLLLIGDGKDDTALLEQCAFLKVNGFANVNVLRGGIVTWVRAERPLIAQTSVVADLPRLSDGDLLQASLRGDKLILLAPTAKSFAPLLTNAVQLSSTEPAQIAAALKQPRGKRTFDAAVLVTDNALADAELKSAAAATPATLFAYAGSAKAFERFLRTQVALWKRADGGQRIRCPGL